MSTTRSDFVNHVTDKPYVIVVTDSDTGKKREIGFDDEASAMNFKLDAEEDGSYYGMHTRPIKENKTIMKKSELKQLIKTIVSEVVAVKQQRLAEAKGLSGFKKSSGKSTHTEKVSTAKTLTSTTKPTEKKEGRKLPVKDKKSNTTTDHFVGKKSTPAAPSSEKKEKARPVGTKKSLKEDIMDMIRETLEAHRMEEMAKTAVSFDGKTLKGSISAGLRSQDPKSPTGWSLNAPYKTKDGKVIPVGTPVDAPSMTGKNYVKKGVAGMGRPTKASGASANGEPATGLEVTAQLPSGDKVDLEYDFLNSSWPQAKSHIESEVMSMLGDAAIDPSVKVGQEVYDAIEKAKEADLDGLLNNSNNKIVLFFDPATKQLRVKK